MTRAGSFVIATAGHVDHGKSTLVRALTGIEPDRWDEEKRRGLTIDLGFAWTRLPSGREVSFVDVPGHERFLGNMLAGVGPAPIVLFVVAADEGWMPQSDDHRDAIAALGIQRGLLVVTRMDLAPDSVPEVVARSRTELAGTGLADAEAIAVSGTTGEGLDALRGALDRVLAEVPEPDTGARVRMWIDRAFSIPGAGTVVTGTLGAGVLKPDDTLVIAGEKVREKARATVTIRGLQSHDESVDAVTPVTRAAVNLRGIGADDLGRGDVLLTPGAWSLTDTVDVRRMTGEDFEDAPRELAVHVGTAAVQARLRPLGAEHARLALARPLPLTVGDRILLRSTGSRAVRAGVQVLDVDPPELARRGDGRRRAETLAGMSAGGDLVHEVRRRGAVPVAVLTSLGVAVPGEGRGGDAARSVPPEEGRGSERRGGDDREAGSAGLPSGVILVRDLLVDAERLDVWAQMLRDAVTADHAADPLSPGLTGKAAVDRLGLPDLGGGAGADRSAGDGAADRVTGGRRASGEARSGDGQQAARATSALLTAIVRKAGLVVEAGRIRSADAVRSMGAAEPAIRELEEEWARSPFRAPEARVLDRLQLGPREIAAAEAQGRLIRLGGLDARGGAGARGGTAGQGDSIVLGPQAPARAMRVLSDLEQPFTTSEARQALDTTRRTVIPLLEHLDSRGWTRRVDAGHREIVGHREAAGEPVSGSRG